MTTNQTLAPRRYITITEPCRLVKGNFTLYEEACDDFISLRLTHGEMQVRIGFDGRFKWFNILLDCDYLRRYTRFLSQGFLYDPSLSDFTVFVRQMVAEVNIYCRQYNIPLVVKLSSES